MRRGVSHHRSGLPASGRALPGSGLLIAGVGWRRGKGRREALQAPAVIVCYGRLEGVAEALAQTGRPPAGWIDAKIGAASGLLTGLVEADAPFRRSHEPDEGPFCGGRATDHARPLRHMPW